MAWLNRMSLCENVLYASPAQTYANGSEVGMQAHRTYFLGCLPILHLQHLLIYFVYTTQQHTASCSSEFDVGHIEAGLKPTESKNVANCMLQYIITNIGMDWHWRLVSRCSTKWTQTFTHLRDEAGCNNRIIAA